MRLAKFLPTSARWEALAKRTFLGPERRRELAGLIAARVKALWLG